MNESPASDLARKVFSYLRRQHWLKPGDRLGVAVSGGADSVALLRSLVGLRGELGIVVSAVHFNHSLRGEESEADQAFVRELSGQFGLELHAARGDVAGRARGHSLSTEAAARQARYEFFWSLIEDSRLDKIATAHTLDDQAETVLLRLIRGTGTRGLGGIHPELTGPAPGRLSRGSIIRPLLHARRRDIERYLAGLGQPWREDSSNRDLHHTRNRVRRRLIPLLEEEFNPEISDRLADLAEIAQAEEDYWDTETPRLLTSNPLQISRLMALPLAVRRRLVRAASPPGLQLEFRQLQAILEVAAGTGDDSKTCNLAEGWAVQRKEGAIAFLRPQPRQESTGARDGAIPGALRLPVPGRVSDPGTSRCFEARRVRLANPPAGYNPEHLYAPHVLPSELMVRTWRFGDRFWPAHTKAPKKLKELFQARKIAPDLRPGWPVMVAGRRDAEEVIWVQGFASPAHLRPGPEDAEAILLAESDSL
jgi:tRNA(Ile)-lysidine synthase